MPSKRRRKARRRNEEEDVSFLLPCHPQPPEKKARVGDNGSIDSSYKVSLAESLCQAEKERLQFTDLTKRLQDAILKSEKLGLLEMQDSDERNVQAKVNALHFAEPHKNKEPPHVNSDKSEIKLKGEKVSSSAEHKMDDARGNAEELVEVAVGTSTSTNCSTNKHISNIPIPLQSSNSSYRKKASRILAESPNVNSDESEVKREIGEDPPLAEHKMDDARGNAKELVEVEEGTMTKDNDDLYNDLKHEDRNKKEQFFIGSSTFIKPHNPTKRGQESETCVEIRQEQQSNRHGREENQKEKRQISGGKQRVVEPFETISSQASELEVSKLARSSSDDSSSSSSINKRNDKHRIHIQSSSSRHRKRALKIPEGEEEKTEIDALYPKKRRQQRQQQQQQPQQLKWRCDTCTFANNDIASSICELCDVPRNPSSSGQKQQRPNQFMGDDDTSSTTSRKKWRCAACNFLNDDDDNDDDDDDDDGIVPSISSTCALCDTPRSSSAGRLQARCDDDDNDDDDDTENKHDNTITKRVRQSRQEPLIKTSTISSSSSSNNTIRNKRRQERRTIRGSKKRPLVIDHHVQTERKKGGGGGGGGGVNHVARNEGEGSRTLSIQVASGDAQTEGRSGGSSSKKRTSIESSSSSLWSLYPTAVTTKQPSDCLIVRLPSIVVFGAISAFLTIKEFIRFTVTWRGFHQHSRNRGRQAWMAFFEAAQRKRLGGEGGKDGGGKDAASSSSSSSSLLSPSLSAKNATTDFLRNSVIEESISCHLSKALVPGDLFVNVKATTRFSPGANATIAADDPRLAEINVDINQLLQRDSVMHQQAAEAGGGGGGGGGKEVVSSRKRKATVSIKLFGGPMGRPFQPLPIHDHVSLVLQFANAKTRGTQATFKKAQLCEKARDLLSAQTVRPLTLRCLLGRVTVTPPPLPPPLHSRSPGVSSSLITKGHGGSSSSSSSSSSRSRNSSTSSGTLDLFYWNCLSKEVQQILMDIGVVKCSVSRPYLTASHSRQGGIISSFKVPRRAS